jgi:hypothetical protein
VPIAWSQTRTGVAAQCQAVRQGRLVPYPPLQCIAGESSGVRARSHARKTAALKLRSSLRHCQCTRHHSAMGDAFDFIRHQVKRVVDSVRQKSREHGQKRLHSHNDHTGFSTDSRASNHAPYAAPKRCNATRMADIETIGTPPQPSDCMCM